jgi:hypothetical protein
VEEEAGGTTMIVNIVWNGLLAIGFIVCYVLVLYGLYKAGK